MSNKETLNVAELEEKKNKYYTRNFITLCTEAFLFSGASSLFSIENVLPTYVSNLSANPFSIALISILYYGLSYGAYIFSCPLGVNAKSPKWISVIICFLQRIGFLFILLSTYTVIRNGDMALAIFYVSLTFHSIAGGLSSPLFTQMVSVSIFKNISSFWGTYSLFGAAGGVIGSLLYTRFLKVYSFPFDYRYTFLVGLIVSVIATAVVSVGIKEVVEERKEKINMKDVFNISKDIMKTNKKFRSFTIIRVITVAADFAVPYYILTILNKPGVPEGYAGVLAVIYLFAKMIASLFLGKIGDKFNPFATVFCCMVFGAVASFLAIFSSSWQLSTVMYIFLAFAVDGTYIATSAASITFSKGKYVPIYSSTISLLCAPIYILVSFGGASIAKIVSYEAMFAFTLVVYVICAIASLRCAKNVYSSKE